MASESNRLHPAPGTLQQTPRRQEYLDATRAFALLLGIVFHASLSFMPSYIGWAVQDVSTSPLVSQFITISHTFRMETFFLLAGLLSYQTYHRKGARAFIVSRLIRVLGPFVAGWFLLRPLMVSGWIMGSQSLRGKVEVMAALAAGFKSLETLPSGIFTGTHLWFLYYLSWVIVLTLSTRKWVNLATLGRTLLIPCMDKAMHGLARSPIAFLILVVPTAAALGFMTSWSMDTPDRSLFPHIPALAIYWGFFALGWMFGRHSMLIPDLTRITIHRGAVAAVGMTTLLVLSDLERDPNHSYQLAAHLAYAVGYAMTMWSLVFLTLGIFRKYFHKANSAVRYTADAAYWLYLIHLPIVVWLQVSIAEFSLHWAIKLAFISSATIAIGLVTYDLAVRSTWIGAWLNGAKRESVLMAWLIRSKTLLKSSSTSSV